jgi:hypothetical protein
MAPITTLRKARDERKKQEFVRRLDEWNALADETRFPV